MDNASSQKYIVLSLLLASILYSLVTAVAAINEQNTSAGSDFLWSLFFALAVAFWTSNDAKSRDLYRPYEYSFFVFLFWPFVLPYHLTRTRGSEGFLLFMGFMSLNLLPYCCGLVVWAYFS